MPEASRRDARERDGKAGEPEENAGMQIDGRRGRREDDPAPERDQRPTSTTQRMISAQTATLAHPAGTRDPGAPRGGEGEPYQ